MGIPTGRTLHFFSEHRVSRPPSLLRKDYRLPVFPDTPETPLDAPSLSDDRLLNLVAWHQRWIEGKVGVAFLHQKDHRADVLEGGA